MGWFQRALVVQACLYATGLKGRPDFVDSVSRLYENSYIIWKFLFEESLKTSCRVTIFWAPHNQNLLLRGRLCWSQPDIPGLWLRPRRAMNSSTARISQLFSSPTKSLSCSILWVLVFVQLAIIMKRSNLQTNLYSVGWSGPNDSVQCPGPPHSSWVGGVVLSVQDSRAVSWSR